MDLAFLGTGLMGSPMARRLLDAGHRVAVFNRTREKLRSLEQAGAFAADCAGEAIARATCVIVMLSDYRAICDVLPQSQDGLDLAGKTVIQMGTILPSESLSLKDYVEQRQGIYLEAPVLGSRDKVASGGLIVMVGSAPQEFHAFCPLFEIFGPDPCYVGPVGTASALKLSLNHMIISLITAFGLSIGMVERAGVDSEIFMKILRRSALFAPTFDKKFPRIQDDSFSDPNFPVKHMLKDVDLILTQAQGLGLPVGLIQNIEGLLRQAIEQGRAEQDYSAITRVINPRPWTEES